MENEKTNDLKGTLTGVVAVILGSSAAYIALGVSAVSGREGEAALRGWYLRLGLVLITAWQLLTVFAALCAIHFVYSELEGAVIKRRARGLIITACLMVLIAFSAGFFVLAHSIPDEISNKNDTITVVETANGTKHRSLWEKDGFLTRRYVRVVSSDPEDIDPSFTEEEFRRRKEEELKARERAVAEERRKAEQEEVSSEIREEDYGNGTDDLYYEDESYDLYDGSEEVVSEQYINDKINDGLVAIYTEISEPADGYEFKTSWSAKGEAGAVIYEDDQIVRFIRYDRQSDNGECCLYVYYEADKAEDGTYSPGDARILGMYAYVMEPGEVIDSGRKAWADPGTEEYRKAVGE